MHSGYRGLRSRSLGLEASDLTVGEVIPKVARIGPFFSFVHVCARV